MAVAAMGEAPMFPVIAERGAARAVPRSTGWSTRSPVSLSSMRMDATDGCNHWSDSRNSKGWASEPVKGALPLEGAKCTFTASIVWPQKLNVAARGSRLLKRLGLRVGLLVHRINNGVKRSFIFRDWLGVVEEGRADIAARLPTVGIIADEGVID
jgi:hypothetical protein